MSCVPEVPLKQVRDRDLDTWKTATYLAYSCCSLCKLTVAKGVPVWGTCTKRHNNGKSTQLKRNHANFKYNVCSCFCLPLKQSVWHSQQKTCIVAPFRFHAWHGPFCESKIKKCLQNACGHQRNQANNGNPLPRDQYVKASRQRGSGAILDGRCSGSLTAWDLGSKWRSIQQYVWCQSQKVSLVFM